MGWFSLLAFWRLPLFLSRLLFSSSFKPQREYSATFFASSSCQLKLSFIAILLYHSRTRYSTSSLCPCLPTLLRHVKDAYHRTCFTSPNFLCFCCVFMHCPTNHVSRRGGGGGKGGVSHSLPISQTTDHPMGSISRRNVRP